MAASDVFTHESGDADNVIKLTLRTCQQGSDDTIRAGSLNPIDQLMEHVAHGFNDVLDEFEPWRLSAFWATKKTAAHSFSREEYLGNL